MVEWKKLGEVCSNMDSLRKPIKEDYRIKGPYPYYGASGIVDYIDSYIFDGDFLLVSEDGANLTARTSPIAFSIRGKNWVNNHAHVLAFENKITQKLVEVYLNSIDLSPWINGAAQPKLNQANLKTIPIPIPSLSEQSRIVSILDTFTSSISNLKQQIEERRKQYEYERDLLLDLEGKEGVEMKKLGEVGEFIRGNGIQKNDFVEEGYGCIHYGQIHARYGFSAKETISKIEESLYKKCKKAKTGDVILATTSEDAEGVAKPFVWLGENDVAVSGDAFIYHHNQIGKFMGYQFLTRKFMQFKVKYATGAKVVRISGENMAKFEIALPSLSEQSRIVSILDTFEQSISNLEEQLAMREKQYEYYRNQLLTFEGEEERGKT